MKNQLNVSLASFAAAPIDASAANRHNLNPSNRGLANGDRGAACLTQEPTNTDKA